MGLLGIMLMLLTSIILLHQTSYVYTVTQNPSSAIPFNLPKLSFCQTCITHANLLTAEPRSEMDRICRNYVSDLYKRRKPSLISKNFMDNMRRIPSSTNSFIFYWALQARVSFEVVFRVAYTYRILVEPEPDDYENCITAFVDGSGFANTRKPENMSPAQNYTYNEGFAYETLFTRAVVYIWGLATCNQTLNFHFINTATRELDAARISTDSITNFNVWSPAPIEVVYNNASLTLCGESNLSPKPPSGELAVIPESCQDVLCPIVAKKSRRSDTPNLPPVNPDLPCPSGKIDPGKGECVPDVGKQSRLFINEIYPCRSGDPDRNEYVELRMYPFTLSPRLESYKLVAFTAFTKKMLLVINIYNRRTINSGFILFNDPMDSSIQRPKDRSSYENFKILPCSTEEPIVLLLLKQPPNIKEGWKDIKLNGKSYATGYSARLLNQNSKSKKNLLDVFKETVVDGIVYGIPINTAISQDVKDLVNVDKNNCNFIIPITNADIENTVTLSLNSCPALDPVAFDAEHFKFGRKTPGSTNDCILQGRFQLQEIEQPRSLQNIVGVTRHGESISDCPANEEKLHPRIAEIDALINYEIRFIREKLDPNYECKYYPVAKFKTDVWPKLAKSEFNIHHPDYPKDITPFERVKPVTDVPQLADNLRCAVCYQRSLTCSHSFHKHALTDSFITSSGRSIPTQTKFTQRYLVEHTNRRTHYTSVLYFVRADRRRMSADAKQKFRAPEQAELRKLANTFLVTFTLVKTNTAINSAPTWYKTLKKLEANVGTGVLLHGAKSARSIISYISMEGFSNIKHYLVQKQYPFTLILDGSSDRTHHHYQSVFIQTLEGEETIAYFIALIPGGKSATALTILQDIKNWLAHQSPEFQQYFKDNIVSTSSDGAAVMSLFQRLMNEWIEKSTPNDRPVRTLVQTYCLAHKLNLASRSALIPLKTDKDPVPNNCLDYFQVIEKFMQSTYTWISLAQRRMGEYREVAEEYRQPKIELKELHIQRWISSEHTTIKFFLKGWVTSLLTTITIENDETNYRPAAILEAKKFHEKLQDKQKLITIVFLQDYTAAFKKWSVILQRFVGLMSDQLDNHVDLLNELEQIGSLNGGVLTGFLRSCTCSDTLNEVGEACSGVEEYEQSVQITWNGNTFYTKDTNAPSLTILGPELIKKSIKRLNHYMPKDLLHDLNVFSPMKFPAGKLVLEKVMQDGMEVNEYGANEVRQLSHQFGIPGYTVVEHWNTLLKAILSSPSWDSERNHDTNGFWSNALRDNTLPWEDDIRRFIRCMKVISVGSALVEGSFSIFNNIKNQRRSRISDSLLESIMNIQINGPSDISHFDEFEYAMSWQTAGRKVVEDMDCESKKDDDEIRDEPIGLNRIDDDLILTDEEESFDIGEDIDVDDNDFIAEVEDPEAEDNFDGDELKRTSPWKYEKINRIRTLLM